MFDLQSINSLLEDLSSLLASMPPMASTEAQAQLILDGLKDGSISVSDAASWVSSLGQNYGKSPYDRKSPINVLRKKLGMMSYEDITGRIYSGL